MLPVETETNQWNTEPMSSPYKYDQQICGKIAKKFNGGNRVFSKTGAKTAGYPQRKKMNFDLSLAP